MDLDSFLKGLAQLRRGVTTYGMAPHKPIFLLAILDLLDQGIGTDNRFYVNLDLVGTFHENWNKLVSEPFKEDFTQPFYHLQKDQIQGAPFWRVAPIPGFVIDGPIKSFRILTEVVDHGFLSPEVFLLMTIPANRILIRNTLMKIYFPDTLKAPQTKTEELYLKNLREYVLNKVPVVTRMKVAEAEMVYVRNWTFKKWVPRIYAHTCAVSEMKLQSAAGSSLIDACHIVPFSREQDDRVSNGIALCPNLHRAFDAGLISIDSDYKVMVSSSIREEVDHPYALSALAGKKILLPREQYQWPSQENLEWHRKSKFLR